MAGVWVFSEIKDTSIELLGEARRLAAELKSEVAAVAVGGPELATELISYGADQVYLLPPLGDDVPVEGYAKALGQLVLEQKPAVFLIGGTLRGKEIAARVAALAETGLSTDCVSLKLDGEKLVMQRLVYGGAGVNAEVCATLPQMATIPPRTFAKPAPDPARKGTVTNIAAVPDTAVKIVGRWAKSKESVNLGEANVIIGVGRGLGGPEQLPQVAALADVVGGELGCTRPVAEAGWLAEDRYIGLSGQKIKPALYITLGVSGQIQHIVGARDAKVIVAVNKDENAPVFAAADYGVVGDVREVVPALTAELKKALGR